jgi:hypothetical protein
MEIHGTHRHRKNVGMSRAVAVAALMGAVAMSQAGCSTTSSSEAYKPAPAADSPVAKQEMQQKIQEVQNDPGVPAAAKKAYMDHMAVGPAAGAMSVGPKPGK